MALDAKLLELGEMKVHGTRYSVPVNSGSIEAELYFDIFEVPGNFGSMRYFILLSDWDGSNPKEESLVRNLLRKSFFVKKEFAKVRTDTLIRPAKIEISE